MPSLPVVGSDSNQWGQKLNDFLLVAHNTDGSSKAWIDVTSSTYGATGNGTTDDTAAINAAIAAAPSTGATIYFPAGTYKITSTISIINKSNIKLVGTGAAQEVWSDTLGVGSTIAWYGASGGSPMIKMGADNTATTYARNLGILNMNLDARDLADQALLIQSVWWGQFRNIYLRNGRVATLDITTTTNNPNIAEDTQGCDFSQIVIRNAAAFSRDNAYCLRIDSGTHGQGNVSMNRFALMQMVTNTAVCVKIGDSDSNRFYDILPLVVAGTSTNNAVEFHGSNSGTGSGHARGNIFYYLQTGGKQITSKGTATYSTPPANNYILMLSQENGTATVNTETGASLYYVDDRGNMVNDHLTAGASGFATSGIIRVPNNQFLTARNAAGNGNVNIIGLNGSDEVSIPTKVRFGGTTFEFNDGSSIITGTTNGLKIGTATTARIGFWNATPIARPSAYTQTYSTADKTLATPTAAALTNSNGTPDTTIADVGTSFSQTTLNNNFRDLSDQINNLRNDLLDLAQYANAVVDDLQATGLVG